MSNNNSKASIEKHINKYIGFDKFFAPLFIIVGILYMLLAFSKGEITGIYIKGIVSGCFLGLGAGSIGRYILGKKVITVFERRGT